MVHSAGLQLFQFQSGTIKAEPPDMRVMYVPMFQFQSGTIKATKRIAKRKEKNSFQFQSGTIKAGSVIKKRIGISVSIPIWYD